MICLGYIYGIQLGCKAGYSFIQSACGRFLWYSSLHCNIFSTSVRSKFKASSDNQMLSSSFLKTLYFLNLFNTLCCIASPPSLLPASQLLRTSQIREGGKSLKLALAGGLAGGVATFLLYPIDVIKSRYQNNPKHVQDALKSLQNIPNFYYGVLPAALGAVPSSAVYFGSYEACKSFLSSHFNNSLPRRTQHALAAASGNILSSILFVPKDVLKHKMQALNSGALVIEGIKGQRVSTLRLVRHIFHTSGVKGFYPSYRATLLKNIPSAVVRFGGKLNL